MKERSSPAAIHDEVDNDVFPEVVTVLERDVDGALDVCEALYRQFSAFYKGDDFTNPQDDRR